MQRSTNSVLIPRFEFGRLWRRGAPRCEDQTEYGADPVEALRAALARETILLRQTSSLVEEQQLLRSESDHRLLNGLQMVVSLLMLQSRAATPDVGLQLSVAASRVATIERIHRCLHSNDGMQSVAFHGYLEQFCRDFSGIMAPDDVPKRTILVECAAVTLPTSLAIPLGFIVNELVTNAVKYGKGQIGVRLEVLPTQGYALVVTNEGPALAEIFDPAACKGLGMKIVQSFVKQIGAELKWGRDDTGQGARFAVHFS